jgi:hypothetical protein
MPGLTSPVKENDCRRVFMPADVRRDPVAAGTGKKVTVCRLFHLVLILFISEGLAPENSRWQNPFSGAGEAARFR